MTTKAAPPPDLVATRRAIRSDAAPPPVGPYSQAVEVGDLVFLSGQVPIDPAQGAIVATDIETQTALVLDHLGAVLAAAGLSLGEVVKTTVYLVDLAEFPRMNAIYETRFGTDPKPARATVGVAALPLGARVEIDAIAIRAVGG